MCTPGWRRSIPKTIWRRKPCTPLGRSARNSSSRTARPVRTDAFLSRFPEHPLAAEATLRRGETLLAAGRYGAAAEWFAQAAGRPGFALADRALARQAAALVQAKKNAEAAGVYAALAKKFPQSPFAESADLAGGKCYRLAGDFAAAQKLLEKSLAAGDEAAPEAAHWLADVLLKENRPAEAAAAINKGLAAADSARSNRGC